MIGATVFILIFFLCNNPFEANPSIFCSFARVARVTAHGDIFGGWLAVIIYVLKSCPATQVIFFRFIFHFHAAINANLIPVSNFPFKPIGNTTIICHNYLFTCRNMSGLCPGPVYFLRLILNFLPFKTPQTYFLSYCVISNSPRSNSL